MSVVWRYFEGVAALPTILRLPHPLIKLLTMNIDVTNRQFFNQPPSSIKQSNMEKNDDEQPTLRIGIMKKKPKKNPVTYELKTVGDIFNMLNDKNINKFMREFKTGMQVSIAARELMKSIVEKDGVPWDNDLMQMPSFTWIDD